MITRQNIQDFLILQNQYEKAERVRKRLKQNKIHHEIDGYGNIYSEKPNQTKIILTAHLDTVYENNDKTDIVFHDCEKTKDTYIYALNNKAPKYHYYGAGSKSSYYHGTSKHEREYDYSIYAGGDEAQASTVESKSLHRPK
jgi:hypothetical protein